MERFRFQYGRYTIFIIQQEETPKETDKYILDNENAWDRIDAQFMSYVEEQNRKHPDRKISNVKILDITFMGDVYLSLE